MTEITIIGAGIAGLALGLGCARRGWAVTVCERSAQLEPVGAGLTLGSSAVSGLNYLGLGDDIARLAEPPDPAIVLDWSSGRLLTRREDAPEHLWKARRVARADLQGLLLDRLLQTGRAELKLGHAFAGFDGDVGGNAEGVTARFENGERRPAALLVGADGARSAVRHAMLGDGVPAFTGHVAWRFILPREVAEPLMHGYGAVITAGPQASLTCYTMGQGRFVNCVAITRSEAWAGEGWSEPGNHAELTMRFADAHPDARALIALADPGQLYRWGLFDRPVTPSWQRGRLALMGDAAHPILPFLAFGAGLAIEDAVMLDRCLTAYPPAQAFARFEATRVPRATAVHAASRAQAMAFSDTLDWEESAPPPFLDPAIHAYDPVTVPIEAS